MRKLTYIGLTLIIIALLTVPAFAKRSGFSDMPRHEDRHMERIDHLSQILELTPEQQARVTDIITERRENMLKHREAVKNNREEIRGILDSETLDQGRLRELVDAQAELKLDRMTDQHRVRSEINQVLTPEQQEKHQAMQAMRQHHQGGHKRSGYGQGNSDM